MKTTNFALQRRRHFIKIIMILCLELIIFGGWTFNILTPENISVSEKMGHVLCTFIGVCILNGFWLYFIENQLFFDKYKILNRIYLKETKYKPRVDYLKQTLAIISKDGKPVHTTEAMILWEQLPGYNCKKFQAILTKLQDELNELYEKLFMLDEKKSFWLKSGRLNLWMYFKSKIVLATS